MSTAMMASEKMRRNFIGDPPWRSKYWNEVPNFDTPP
jgi:hypothetical protein